ncbi:hypothetical protein JNUCC64_11945 [Streptomyces sp. JNUCC 64]
MARHQDHSLRSLRPTPSARGALLRAGLALGVAGVALGAGAATAGAAAPEPAPGPLPSTVGDLDARAAGHALGGAVGYVTGPLTALQLNPLAGTGVDPLANGVGTQIADFKPLSTTALTAPLARGDSLGELPLVGPVTGLLAR